MHHWFKILGRIIGFHSFYECRGKPIVEDYFFQTVNFGNVPFDTSKINFMSPLLNFRSLVFKLSKLKFITHNLFNELLKWANKCIINRTGGVVCATPEGMGHHNYIVKCKNNI